MPRIPDTVLDRLKRHVSVVQVVQASGVKLTRRGSEWIGLCPLHSDQKTPSLSIHEAKKSWHCFGCDRGGSVIDWRMETEKMSFRPAVESLLRDYLPDVEISEPTPEQLPTEEVERLIAAPDAELLRWVLWVYGQEVGDAKLQEYLASRGLEHPDLAEHFQLGYSTRTLGLMLPAKAWKAGKLIRGRLQKLGILRASGHEHLAGRLVVPLWTLEHELGQLYGRAITRNLRAGTPDHLYLEGERGHCLFHPEAVAEHRELILCEAPLDALTYWAHGFRNVTTTYGTSGFPKALFEAMERYGTRRVLIAFDRDEAGDRAAKKIAEKLLAAGIECYRVLFPKGMDANDVACKIQPAAKSLDLGLRQASWMGTGRPPSEPVPEMPSKSAAKKEQPEAAEERELLSSLAAPATSADSTPQEVSPASGPPATVLPASPPKGIPTEISEHEVVMKVGDRRYRVRGLAKNHSLDVLKVNLLASRAEAFHVDNLDLYSSRPRAGFLEQAATELGLEQDVVKDDLRQVLLRLEELQAKQIAEALEPKEKAVEIPEANRREALEHAKRPDLVTKTLADLTRSGIVGEDVNKLLVYLVAVSRKLASPLAVLIQSSSAAGKSALLDGVLALIPEEERVGYSAMTGQSLYYMSEQSLCHKVLSIAEEEGAERASYALKLLQSEGKLSIASTGKDPATGRLTTHEYHVEGPAAILTTTTAIDLDEEFQNRCLVLSVDESREQTEAIHRYQRRAQTLEGLMEEEERRDVRELHRNVQRLLQPFRVVNPFAEDLTFPATSTRARRDHRKYLGLIEAIALLHQHQREVRTMKRGNREVRYLVATEADVALANRLASEVLGRTLDELPPQTQRLLEAILKMVSEACEELEMKQRDYRFSRREVREYTGWGNTQLKMHLRRLEDLEYLLVHRGCRGQAFVYELLWDGEGVGGERFMMGLIPVGRLGISDSDTKKSGSGKEKSGAREKKSGPSRPQVGGVSGGGRGSLEPTTAGVSGEKRPNRPKNAHLDPEKALSSQRSRRSLAQEAVS